MFPRAKALAADQGQEVRQAIGGLSESGQVMSRLGARAVFGLAAFAFLLFAITSQREKRLTDFDQAFYLTIAYDLSHHGVFSNGVFDDVDSTKAVPPPGMFFGPIYPALVYLAMKADPRFQQTIDCVVRADHEKTDVNRCGFYARPIHILHAALQAIGVIAIALTAEAIFGGTAMFFLAGLLAALGLAGAADLSSFIMTESLGFSLYSLAACAFVLGLKTGSTRTLFVSGIGLGLLILARPSFLVLLPVAAVLVLIALRRVAEPPAKSSLLSASAFVLAVLCVLGPWLIRNTVSVGKFALTEEYGSAALIERFAYDDITPREFLLSFPYCVPVIGPSAVERWFGADATARFEWYNSGGFFDVGRAHRNALVAANKQLDPLIANLVRSEIEQNGWHYLASIVPLAWCGLWVGQIWSVFFMPFFAVACVEAVRRKIPLFLLYAGPALLMVGVHGAVANHYSRYNLMLIGPMSAGAAWIILRLAAFVVASRQIRQPT
jgi:hypothetical protein